MKKNIIKKLFIKLSKILGYEIIDQSDFSSPTLEKQLNENLSIISEKSIILPLGEVKITKKVSSVLIIFRTNTDVEIWDQNKRRLFEQPKIEYALKALNSLIKSIDFSRKKYPNIKFKVIVVDDNSKEGNLNKLKKLIDRSNLDINIIPLNHDKYKDTIKQQKNDQTFSNLASLLQSFELAKEYSEDLVFFVEDDYLHFEPMMEEMIASYERIASQLNRDIFICPADYPYLYMNNEKTNILIGNKRHWRTVNQTLCTFMTTKSLLNKYWENFYNTCLDRHEPFEKYLNNIYKKEFCISPIKSLSLHLTNVNSSYGLSPFIDYKKLWDENDITNA
ncbi:glycosyltransferase family 2 protein [Candidatus Pelagibacter bacterium]|nr:glycosyltransferase family 2 protein [Candidatus Pelagibacter bacterium]MDA8800991.1 glycosyltransferase family 2 protein [Candidatus Pelagibacter bacterium]